MADDERPDERDPEIAQRLAVEPLDELTRRRLVKTAVREGSPSARYGGRWRATLAIAATILVVAGAVALLTAQGGHDEPAALRDRSAVTAAPSTSPRAPVAAGDFGDLDQAANLDALRDRLTSAASNESAQKSTADSGLGTAGAAATVAGHSCPFDPPAGATILGDATGTIDGRPATVYLVERANGSRTYEAVLEGPCESRHLP